MNVRNEYIFWGYGLFPDKDGDFIKKKMGECTGEEILKEVLYHLPVDNKEYILGVSHCIPTEMPFITSQFNIREKYDRPKVIPDGAENFGFLGQYVEIKDDVVFTVEYSVRSAMMAVYSLLGINKKVPPVYRGYLNPIIVWRAIKALLR